MLPSLNNYYLLSEDELQSCVRLNGQALRGELSEKLLATQGRPPLLDLNAQTACGAFFRLE